MTPTPSWGWLALALTASRPAWALSVDPELDALETEAQELEQRVQALELEARPGSYLSQDEAVGRFQDYLFLHLIGDHQPAAEGFFALVTTGALTDAGLHRDAEWYLAEALVGLENYKTAAVRYQAIVDDDSHPFRDDGVRRLLELFATSEDRAAFDALYQQEIASGRVKPTGLITYSLAKGFFQQGQLDKAAEEFAKVPADNVWYGRARYYLGTIEVARGNLDAAKPLFLAVTELGIESSEDRMVHDLALLALGRIAYHEASYYEASEYYNRIGGDSAFQDDKLYEIIWTSIRRSRWRDALNNVEIFLLAYPDHEYSAQLLLLQGHLNFQEKSWAPALGAYEQVVNEYSPVQARFATLSSPNVDADVAVRAVLEAESTLATPDAAGLPPYAVSLMRADPILSRAMDVFRDLDLERRDIETSELLIDELRAFLEGSGSIGSYERNRTDTVVVEAATVRNELSLLAVEERWLASNDPSAQARLSAVSSRRAAAEQRLAAISERVTRASAELSTFERAMGELHAESDNARRDATQHQAAINGVRAKLAEPALEATDRQPLLAELARFEGQLADANRRHADADAKISVLKEPSSVAESDLAELALIQAEVRALVSELKGARPAGAALDAARIDGIDSTLSNLWLRIADTRESIAKLEGVEVTGIRRRFEEEVAAVAGQRQDHDATVAAAREVSRELTQDGFGRLEDFFADSVLKADMGIVDVMWAERLELADELERVRKEREMQMADLDRRFRLIREKMGEAQ